MPRRYNDQAPEEPRRKSLTAISNSIDLQGEVITDISGKSWKLGKPIGIGGFGEIYQASDDILQNIKTDTTYVAKVERHTNGPLFVEINCYLRIAKLEMIDEWKDDSGLLFLGVPHYVASGSHMHKGERYRFLILPKYEQDLEKMFREKKLFNLKTVLIISSQILDVLEYMHSRGYVHSDIKASNIMLGKRVKPNPSLPPRRKICTPIGTRSTNKRPRKTCTRNLRAIGNVSYIDDIPYLDEVLNMHENKNNPDFVNSKEKKQNTSNSDQVFLLDYGLASKYLLSSGEHRQFCRDERRAHAGTVLFCSRDAHTGVPSRRSDLESLAYNMVYWLTGSLPWIDDVDQPELCEKQKNRLFTNLQSFLEFCFNSDYPKVILEYFNYLHGLQFEENPDYDYIRGLFKKAVKSYGYKDDSRLDFDNLEGWGSKQKKLKRKVIGLENNKIHPVSLMTSPLMPLHSNIIFKRPKLRKKIKNIKIKDSRMNWSKILMDPETIMKQATRERKTTEGSDPGANNLSSMDLDSLNPTYAMLEIYNKCKERDISPRYKGDSFSCAIDNIDGYTPAMMNVYTKMKERQVLEYEAIYNNNNNRASDKNSRLTRQTRVSKRTKRCASPQVQRLSSRTKSQSVVAHKKESLQLKKVKSVPIRRPYSLRG